MEAHRLRTYRHQLSLEERSVAIRVRGDNWLVVERSATDDPVLRQYATLREAVKVAKRVEEDLVIGGFCFNREA